MNAHVSIPDAIEPDHLPDAIEPDQEPAPRVVTGELVTEPAAEEQALARQATDLVSTAKALQITDPASFEHAGELLQVLKDQARHIEAFFEPDVQRAHAAWKGLCTKRAGFLDPLKEAITIVSSRYATFAQEERRKAEVARRQREQDAQEAERKRLQDEADARAAEAQRLEEAARQATSRDEALALEQQAESAKADAADIRQEATTVQAPVLPLQPAVTVPKGTSVRANWTFRVTDKMALVKAVAAGTVSLEALETNDTYLRARAKADKHTVVIPGIQFYDAGSVAHSRRR